MANLNGLSGAVPVFFDGTSSCWAPKNNPVFTGSIAVSDSTSACTIVPSGIVLSQQSGTRTAFITSDTNGDIVLTADPAGQIRIFPGGAGSGAGIVIEDNGLDCSIAPFDNTQTQLICQSMPGYRAITGTGGSGIGMGEENCGVVNWVTVTSAGGFTLQVAGGGLIAGTTLLFAFNPASFAGATVNITNNTTVLGTFTPSTAAPGEAANARVFTPNGTDWFILP